MNKVVMPALIRKRTQIPASIEKIHYADLSDGLDEVSGVVSLLNSLTEVERKILINKIYTETLDNLTVDDNMSPDQNDLVGISHPHGVPFNLIYYL
ncbi:MAG: hypothetical protein AAFR81_27395, partial [Chloroflexota bacterium]